MWVLAQLVTVRECVGCGWRDLDLRMDAEQAVLQQLSTLELNELKQVHEELKLPEVTDETKKENALYVRRMIVRHLSSDTVVDEEDEGLATFLHIQTFIKGITKDPVEEEKEEPEPEVTEEKVELQNDNKNLEDSSVRKKEPVGNVEELKKKEVKERQDHEYETQKRQDELFRNFPWKKELKLKGTIGDPKDQGPGKVTYLSLIRQIEKWVKKKKYSDEEICDAVIEGISSELFLRSMLEGKFDLTVAKLRRFLPVHYEEKDATEVYRDLTRLSQGRNQKVKEFVMQAIGLRDKIIFASTEAGNRFNYPEELVRSTCWHTVVTGIRDDNIKNEIKAILSAKDPDDEELLEILNTAVSDEKERQGKFKETAAKANLVEQKKLEATAKRNEESAETKPERKENPVVAELKEIKVAVNEIKSVKNDVEILKEVVRNLSQNTNGNGGVNSKVQYGCKNCKSQNLQGCDHCFKCCQTGHKKENCPN